jgi:hypothetical protein
VTAEGLISISGTSYSDEAAYSFVRWLETAPHVRRVVLEGTSPAKFGTYSATTFDVQCEAAAVEPPSQERQ